MNDTRFPVRSLLTALLTLLLAPAAQAQSHSDVDPGSENQAFITQIGEAQRATINETNIAGGLLSGVIRQTGIGNEASISLKGGDLSGSITQDGNDNRAALGIRGEANSGAIAQYGDDNSAALRIDGYGKDVTLIQEGNGHAFKGPVKVGGDSLPGLPITIRQY